MPTELRRYNIFLSCPSDVTAVRDIADEAIVLINNEIAPYFDITLKSLRWRKDLLYGAKGTAQQQINSQLIAPSDAIIAIFSGKLGTPTDLYPSGSLEEIEKMIDSKRQVWVYFSNMSVPQSSIDISELKRIDDFKQKYSERGIYDLYDNSEDFRDKVLSQLRLYIRSLINKTLPKPSYIVGDEITKSNLIANHILPCFIKATLNLNNNDDIHSFVRCVVVKYDYEAKPVATRKTVLAYGRANIRRRVENRPMNYGIVGIMNREEATILYDFQNDICYRATPGSSKTITVSKNSRGTVDDRLGLLVAPIWKNQKIWGALSFDFFDLGEFVDSSLESRNIIKLISDPTYLNKILHNASFFSEVFSKIFFNNIISDEKNFL